MKRGQTGWFSGKRGKRESLTTQNIAYRLLIKESLVIRAYGPRLNRTTHSVPLIVFPEGLERNLVPDPNG